MAEGSSTGNVSIGLDDATLAVDARPGLLVAVLPQDGGPAMAVAMSTTTTASSAVPADATRLSFLVTDELSIEASPSSTFVALRGEDGRIVVSAFSGEVVVRPFGPDGERFAVTGREVLVAPPGAQADAIRVTPTGEVAEADRVEIDGLLGTATTALGQARPVQLAVAEKPSEEPAEEPAKEPAEAPAETAGAPAEAVAAGEPAADEKPPEAPTKHAPKAPAEAKAAAEGGKRKGKTKAERKLERSEAARRRAEEREKRAAAAGAPAAAAAATPAPPKKASPTKKAGARSRPSRDRKAPAEQPSKSPAMKKPSKVRQAGGADAGTRPPTSARPKKLAEADEERRERRALPLMLLGGVVIAAAVLFFATRGDDGSVDVAQPSTTVASPTTEEPATTAAPTTAAPTTTEAPTTMVAAVPNYSFVPKSCEQDGQEITYTAEVTNRAEQAYDFVVQVLFKDSDGRTVAEKTATVGALGPGRTTTVTATGTSNRDLAGSGASCNVEKIDATPA